MWFGIFGFFCGVDEKISTRFRVWITFKVGFPILTFPFVFDMTSPGIWNEQVLLNRFNPFVYLFTISYHLQDQHFDNVCFECIEHHFHFFGMWLIRQNCIWIIIQTQRFFHYKCNFTNCIRLRATGNFFYQILKCLENAFFVINFSKIKIKWLKWLVGKNDFRYKFSFVQQVKSLTYHTAMIPRYWHSRSLPLLQFLWR